MDKQPLYTFVLAHYNQYRYIFTAVDSILGQDYPEIEIIVMDDCSGDFRKDEVLDYIERNKRDNIKAIQILVNEENIGTVRSFNRALKAVKGDFVHFFAADDRMHDEKVASGFIDALNKQGDTTEMICAHALVMDEELTPPGEYSLPPEQHERYNVMDAGEQFENMSIKCDWAMGAVCARTELYKRMGYFSEDYKYIEDWSFFLMVTRSGVKVHMADFIVLEHRSGGISQSFAGSEAPQAFGYVQDIIVLREKEVFPYMKSFSLVTQDDIIERYSREYETYEKMGGQRRRLRWYDYCKYSKKIVMWRILKRWRSRIKML